MPFVILDWTISRENICIMTDKNGSVLFFETEKKAKRYAKREAQYPEIVEV